MPSTILQLLVLLATCTSFHCTASHTAAGCNRQVCFSEYRICIVELFKIPKFRIESRFFFYQKPNRTESQKSIPQTPNCGHGRPSQLLLRSCLFCKQCMSFYILVFLFVSLCFIVRCVCRYHQSLILSNTILTLCGQCARRGMHTDAPRRDN